MNHKHNHNHPLEIIKENNKLIKEINQRINKIINSYKVNKSKLLPEFNISTFPYFHVEMIAQ